MPTTYSCALQDDVKNDLAVSTIKLHEVQVQRDSLQLKLQKVVEQVSQGGQLDVQELLGDSEGFTDVLKVSHTWRVTGAGALMAKLGVEAGPWWQHCAGLVFGHASQKGHASG
jgi:hypothetical protein